MLVIVSTIPTGIIGIAAKDLVSAAEQILLVPGICLIITAVLLFIADRIPDGGKTPKQVTYTNAFLIGISQGIATMPGLSRSGTTITACLSTGMTRKFAVKYSFILSIPAILGALVVEIKDVEFAALQSADILNYIVGTLVAAIVGYICIKTMLVVVRKEIHDIFHLLSHNGTGINWRIFLYVNGRLKWQLELEKRQLRRKNNGNNSIKSKKTAGTAGILPE